MKNAKKVLIGFLCVLITGVFIQFPTEAANYVVTFVAANQTTTQIVEAGKDAVPPTDVNVKGYAFCGWSVNTKNVQSNLTAQAIYLPESAGSGQICTTYKNAPDGVLSYSTATNKSLQISTAASNVPPTPMATPCTLTAAQTVTMNPVGVPGVTCVVRWYNGSTSELWKTDVVAYGASLPQPANPCQAGLEFIGWDGSWNNITTDRNIIACYYKNYTVKYICGICGEVQDIQYIRRGDSCTNCTAHDHSGVTFKYWADPVVQEDGTTAKVVSVYEVNK